MQGNSWLGVSQINHAARDCHPALKCIAPWEGHAVSHQILLLGLGSIDPHNLLFIQDHYRDVMVRGGIPQVAFGNWMQGKLGKATTNNVEAVRL